MCQRKLRDYIKKLECACLKLKSLSSYEEVSFEKAQKIKEDYEKMYNKLIFYKKMALYTDETNKRR